MMKMLMNRLLTLFAGLALFNHLPAQAEQPYPAYYPESYEAMVSASKEEDKLLIYSNIAEYNWHDILEGFRVKYPWIKIESIDLGPSTSFERYYSESSVGKRSADLIVTGAPDGWHRFAVDEEELLSYASPESEYLPDWSRPEAGLYTISADPMIIIFNKMLLDEQSYPHSLEDLNRLVERRRDSMKNKLTTYNASSHSFAYDIHWAVAKHLKDSAWPLYDTIGSVTRPESGGATMVEKVTGGEYWAGYFVSGITVFPRMSQKGRDRILGWSLINDGTPVFIRNMGITKRSSSPNSAKLMLDYILSHEGQIAVGNGGLTPYREDVSAEDVPYLSYHQILSAVGSDNVVIIGYDKDSYSNRDTFLGRWSRAYGLNY